MRGTSTTENLRCDGDSFHSSDSGRASEDADSGWERWFKPWFSHLTLEGLDETSLLSTNVSTSTTVEVDIEWHTAAAGVLTYVSTSVCLLDSPLKDLSLVDELSADVNVGTDSTHRSTSHEASLDEAVRVGAHDLAVLAGTWL